MIYFQGTDNTIWHINPDGSGGAKLGGFKAKSRPIAYGNTVYFQGTDDKLCQCNLDGSNLSVLGGNTTSSAPFVVATGVYFRGTDNKLWRINFDGTGQVNLGNNTTSSTPFVIGQYCFFQGTDNKLWRILIDGTEGINIGFFQTSSSPFATSQYVYFRGTDDKLWRTDLDGGGAINLGGGYKTSATPFVTDQFVYFRGTDNKLWKTNLDGSNGVNLGGYQCNSSPTVDTSQNFIYFQGTDNALWRINMDGSNGNHLGGFNTSSTPWVVQPANQPQTGSFPVPYVVLALVYAPPGTNSGKNDSQVEYSSSSIAGTTLTISNSFNKTLGLTASLGFGGSTSGGTGTGAGGGSGGSGGGGGGMPPDSVGFGVSYANTTGDLASLDIKKTTTNDLKVPGPGADGVNHNEDRIYLLLNPTMNIIIDPNYNMNWNLDFAGDNAGVVYVQMDWLQDLTLFAKVQPDVKARCDKAGLTATDYANLLAINPFARGVAPIDPNRYLLTSFQPSYQPPGASSDPVPVQTFTLSNTTTYTAQHTDTTTWGVSLAGEADIGLPDAMKLVLKFAGSFSWTTSTMSASSNAETQSAIASIGGPAFGYTGATRLRVYWDLMFGTFMFYLSDDDPTYTGIMRDASGKPVVNTEVELKIGTQSLYTMTDAKGAYHFYDTPKGATGTVSVVVHKRHVGHGPVKVSHKPEKAEHATAKESRESVKASHKPEKALHEADRGAHKSAQGAHEHSKASSHAKHETPKKK